MELLLCLLIIVWLFVLPIVLPIVFWRKYKRIKKAVIELYALGEISKAQYIECVEEMPPFERVETKPLVAKVSESAKRANKVSRQIEQEDETSGVEVEIEAEKVKTHEIETVNAAETPETSADESKQVAVGIEMSKAESEETPETSEGESKPVAVGIETPKAESEETPETSEGESKPVAAGIETPEAESEEAAETSEGESKQVAAAIETSKTDNEETSETSEDKTKQVAAAIETSEDETRQAEEKAEAPENKAKLKDKMSVDADSESQPERLAARNALEDKEIINSPMIPIPVILGLGVVLICTAGAAYISSFWGTASNLIKLIAVGSFSLIFYGAFRLAHNKLQIEHSAKAFYILCIAALGITATAAELFGLILGNASPAAMMLLPCVVIAAGMFRGYYIFKSKLFPILGILFVFLFLTALSSTIFDDHAMMFFIPAIVSTVGLAYVTVSKKESAIELRKPALVLFLVFTFLLMLSTFALSQVLHQNLMIVFALSLAIIMHILLHQNYNRFVEFAIPVALGWAVLTVCHCCSASLRLAALFICFGVQCVSVVMTYASTNKHDRKPEWLSILLHAIAIGIVGFSLCFYRSDGVQGYAWFMPGLTFIVMGANLIQFQRTLSAKKDKCVEVEKISDGDEKLSNANDNESKETFTEVLNAPHSVAAWLALCAGCFYTTTGYALLESNLQLTLIWLLNLIISTLLLAVAIIPERFHAGDIRIRRYVSFILMIVFALWDIHEVRHSSDSILTHQAFHQILLLIPAFALALIERVHAIRTGRRYFAIASHVSAIAIVIWFVPLVMLILNDMLSGYLILGQHLDLADYIFPVDALLLAGILMYEPKVSLLQNLSRTRLGISVGLICLAYLSLVQTLSGVSHVWYLNLGTMAVLLTIALVKTRCLTCDVHLRRCASLIAISFLALYQFYIFRYDQNLSILIAYPFNQIIFLVPAFGLAFIERANAIKAEQRSWTITFHACAVAIVLWFVPLIMLIINVYLSKYTIWGMNIDLSHYILSVDSLLLAGILLYEPKKPLCPQQSIIRLGASAILIGLSYICLCIAHYQNLTGETTIVRVIPWIAAALYLAVILFYSFRKKIAFAEAPHLRLRAAMGLFTTMSLVQITANPQIAAVMFIPALAMMVLDDRRSAKLKAYKEQTISAIILSVLIFGLLALIILEVEAIFDVTDATKEVIQKNALSAIALLFSLAVLAEHLVMHQRENRPYRLVATVDIELTTACAIFFLLLEWPSELPIRLMLLAAGLIGTWCMSCREHRKYGQITALALFVGLFGVLDLLWHHLNITIPDYFVWIATAVLTAALAFIDGYKRIGITNLRLIWNIPAVPLILVHNDPYHIAHLAGVLIVSLNLLQYLRERGRCDHDRILITISSDIMALASMMKIIMLPNDAWLPIMIRPELIFLIPVGTMYLVSYFVWKFRNYSHEVCSIVALIGLPLVYLIPDTYILFHAITVSILAIVSIVVAIRTKLNRYLTIGIVSIVIIFFSQTKHFWSSLHWWVYLAVVGVVLLAIAVLNETERRKGSTLLQLLKGFIARSWKW